MAPIKAISLTLLDDEESQHKDGLRKAIKFLKSIGDLLGGRWRWKDAASVNIPINVGSFAKFLKFEL